MFKNILCIAIGSIMLMTGLATNRVEAATRGNGNGEIMTVTTKADWSKAGAESITLKNNTIRVNLYHYLTKKTSVKTGYPVMNIVVKDLSTNKVYKRATMSGESLKITLGSNKKYSVQVSHDYYKTISKFQTVGLFTQSMTDPYWQIWNTVKCSVY